MNENEIASEIVDAALRVHRRLGPGLFESVYEAALAYELSVRGRSALRQQPIPVQYDGITLAPAFRADLVVDDAVLIEIKSVETVSPLHKTQLLTYLRLSNKRLGLLINFNSYLLRDGITRIANGL